MTFKEMQQTKAFANLIGKGFNEKPFGLDEEVILKWDLEEKTHITVFSVVQYSLRGDIKDSPISQQGLDAIASIQQQLQTAVPSSGRVIKDVQCKFEGIFVLITMFMALYVGKMTTEEGQDILPDKTELIKFLDGFFTKIKRV